MYLIITKHTYYNPINYWVTEVFYLELSNKDTYLLQPDGYSYIFFSNKKEQAITCFKPQAAPLILTTSYFVVKCRPTYIAYLKKNNIELKASNAHEFLTLFSTLKLKNFTPSLLDSIIFYLHYLKGNTSLPQLSKRYQCKTQVVETQFKQVIGLSFEQYKNIVLKAA